MMQDLVKNNQTDEARRHPCSNKIGILGKSMRILAAYKVEVLPEGIIITDKPPEKLDTDLPPRPIRKKV